MHQDVKRFKEILKEKNLKGKDVYKELGYELYSSYRYATMPSNQKPPNWIKAFNYAYSLNENKQSN